MRRTGLSCCACAASGHAAADPTTTLIKSRRRIACPEAQDYANNPDYIRDLSSAKWASEAWLHGRKLELRMSALGQKQTSAHIRVMSALPPKADITAAQTNVRFVPKADVNARSLRSTAGSGRGLCQHREAVTLEYRFGRRRSQKRQILDRPGLGVHGRRHRIV